MLPLCPVVFLALLVHRASTLLTICHASTLSGGVPSTLLTILICEKKKKICHAVVLSGYITQGYLI